MRSITLKNVDYRKIYEVTDVDDFNFNTKVNRALNPRNVKKFTNLMKNDKYDPEMGIIIVDVKTGTICDGQHRVEGYKGAKELYNYQKPLLVRYVNAPQKVEDLQNYIRSFQSSMKWQLEDYISANLTGKNDLMRLREFCLSHPLLTNGVDVSWSKGACIVARDSAMKVYKDRLKRRDCRFSYDEWNNAEKLYSEIEKIFTAMGKTKSDAQFEYIVNAWKEIRYDVNYLEKICHLPNKYETVFKTIEDNDNDGSNKIKYPSGQGKGVWYEFFAKVIDKAYSNTVN